MSNKDTLEFLVKELLVQRDVSEQLNNFTQLYPLITSYEINTYETEFSHIVKLHLNSGNVELQKCALTLLNICLTELQIVTKEDLYTDTAYQIVEIAFVGTTDSIENQELWLKAFTAISLLENVFKELCTDRTVQIISILTKSLGSLTNSVQKVKALQMFNKLLSNIEAQNVNEDIHNMLISVWWNYMFPISFKDQSQTIQKAAIQCAINLLPYVLQYLRDSNQVWKEICATIQEQYIPVMSNLIDEKNDFYGELWTYLIKLIGDKINSGIPVLNSLLSVIETAFKSLNFDIRITAFKCWQVLIECMFVNPEADSRRIKLLIIPLKTNNSKTEELTRVKFETWFTLFNVLKAKNQCNAVGIIDLFLSFCFGPLDAPLKSYSHPANISPGKKYFRFHLTCCRALLQIMGNSKYFAADLIENLKKFSITGPILTLDGFVQISEIIVNSVGECSVMMGNLQVSDDCVAMNNAVWKSLFGLVDSVPDEEDKSKIVKQVASMIVAVVSLARRKTNLLQFSVLPLFDNIISDEFKFFNEDIMFELIFLPMLSSVLKKDKALLRPEIIPLFEKIFQFKRNSPNFITFLDSALKRITVVPREELPMEKLEVLQSLWFLVEPELVVLLTNVKDLNAKSLDENLYISLYKEYLYWPAASLYRFSNTTLVTKWKNMYDLFGQCTTSVIQIKLANVLLQSMFMLIQRNPHVIVLAELVRYVIENLRIAECTEDNCADVYGVYDGLRNIVSLSRLSADTLDIYQCCVSHVLVTSSALPYLQHVIQPMTDCLDIVLNQHKKTGVLAAVDKFFTTLKYTDHLESHIISMVDILKSLPTLTVELTRLVTTAESVTKIKFDLKRSRDSSSSEQSSKRPKISKKDKDARISLLGHDVDTMTPIKVKGSLLRNNTTPKQAKSQLPGQQKLINDDDNFVVIHTPYKFDPKKLTKKQKSKLSRRRDDIPALYQDLSQSQSQNLCSNSESFPEVPVSDNKQQEKKTENVDIEMNGIEKPEETSEAVRPFAELSKTYSESSTKENTGLSILEKSSAQTNENKPGKVKRGRRKSTGNVQKASVERNAAIFDYAGIIFTDNEEPRPGTIRKTLPDRDFESDNDIIRKRVQKELQKIKIDVNDSEEYKNKNTKRRTRTNYLMIGDLVDGKKIKKSKGNSELNATVDDNDTSSKMNEKSSEKKTVKIKTLVKPSEVSMEKEIRDNNKAEEPPIQVEIDSEPVIESSQDQELSCKPFKIPALHQFQKIKPGEHIVIKDCQSTVDLVVKGPKATSPFKVINKSGVKVQPGRKLFSDCDDTESLVLVEELEIAEADARNLEKPNNSSVKDQMAVNCDNDSYSVIAAEECDNNDSQCMSHLHIEPDSPKVTLDTTNCKENSASKDTVVQVVNPNDTTVSVNSQFIAELDAAPRNISVVEMPDDDITSRKLVFNTSASSDVSVNKNSEFHSPPSNVQRNGIVTSPVCSNTPTRNSEFIQNTLEISPIEDVPNDDSNTTLVHTESLNNSVIASTATRSEHEHKQNDTSPLLFSNDNVGEINKSASDSKQDYNGTPTLRKNKARYVSTRGAQMMNMVSANTPLATNGAKKQKIALKFSINKQVFSPQQSRIAKMMGQFEKNDTQESSSEEAVEQKISEQDIFTFCKELPRPTASPSCGILRKRKLPDYPEDGLTPASKRKRVNFSDPEVSCRKYIERNARHNYSPTHKSVDIVPRESRVTRSSKNDSHLEQDDSEPIMNKSQRVQIESEQVYSESGESDSGSFEDELDSVEDESGSIEDEFISTYTLDMSAKRMENMIPDGFAESLFNKNRHRENMNSPLRNMDVQYDNTRPICADLETCPDSVDMIIGNLTTDFIEAYASNLQNANIQTVGDMARMTEYEVYQLPLNVEKVKKLLKEYSNRIHGNTLRKPVSLAAVLEIDEDTRTESVIIPLGHTDNNSASTDVPMVDETAAPSEPLLSDKLCNGHTEMDMAVDEEEYNLPSTSTLKLNESANGDSYSRYISPPKNNETIAKENILDVNICGVALKDIAPKLMLALNDRRYDPKPFLQILFGNGSNLTNTAVSMGLVQVHHLVHAQMWDSVLNDVITHVGIWKLIKHLCKIPSIPHTAILESVLKNIAGQINYTDLCDQLSPNELLKYVTTVFSLSDILKQYDSTTIYKAVNEVCTNEKHDVQMFDSVMCKLFSEISPNPSDVPVMMNNLSVVEIGESVVKRFGESPDMDLFLNIIFNRVSVDRYLRPVPKSILAASPSPTNTSESLDDTTRDFILEFKYGTVSSSVLKELFGAVCAKMNSTQLLNAYCEAMKKQL